MRSSCRKEWAYQESSGQNAIVVGGIGPNAALVWR